MLLEPLVPPPPPRTQVSVPAQGELRSRLRPLLALGAVLSIAAAARLAPWSHVFTADGVRLVGDGDAYYHALRAERIARDWPHVPWLDPGMNFPYGAEIPWPPLLDQAIASLARLTGPITPDRIALVAALLVPLISMGVVLLTARISKMLLGSRDSSGVEWGGLDAALLVALLPSAVRHGMVGRADHHVAEVLLATTAFIGYAAGLKGGRSAPLGPWLLGMSVTLAFWNWPGSALYLLVLVGHLAVWHVLAPPGESSVGRAARTLALGAAVAAASLAASIAAWGPPGALASGALAPITGLSVALCVVTATFSAAIALARARDADAPPFRRAAHAAVAGLVPLALVIGFLPSVRAGVGYGLVAVGAANTWYASIDEFRPIVFGGRAPVWSEVLRALTMFGLAPLVVPAVGPLVVRAWRERPEDRPSLSFFVVWGATFIGLAIVRMRFDVYAALPFAACAAWCIREWPRRLMGRPWASPRVMSGIRLAALACVVAPGLSLVARGDLAAPSERGDSVALLRWMRDFPAPAPGRDAVIAGWAEGHHVQWFARKPVVSTPFGTDIDPRSITDAAEFFLARDEETASELLQRRGVGFILLTHPLHEVATLAGFAPGAQPLVIRETTYGSSFRYRIHRDFVALFASRLYFFDGNATDVARPVGTARLLAESPESERAFGVGVRVSRHKLFGTVRGAEIEVSGAAPGTLVTISVEVRTNTGRAFSWSARATADTAGAARVRVPYATGMNGQVVAGSYFVASERTARTVAVSEAQVLQGDTLGVDLQDAAQRD